MATHHSRENLLVFASTVLWPWGTDRAGPPQPVFTFAPGGIARRYSIVSPVWPREGGGRKYDMAAWDVPVGAHRGKREGTML